MTKRHNLVLWIALWPLSSNFEQQRSQFSVMNDIVNNKKGHNIVNDNSFATSHTTYLLAVPLEMTKTNEVCSLEM